MQMRQQNGWLLVLSLSQESWLHVWLVALWYICVPLCCLMWLCLRQHSKAIQLPVNWPVLWGSVSKIQMYNSVSVCSRVALRPDTTNHSPDVPTPHNSPVWNSTNPISAAVVSTVGPHSWACHRPQIRPLWLLCCIPVITPKICWSQQTALGPPPTPWIYGCSIVSQCPSKWKWFLKVPPLSDQWRSVLHIQLTLLLDGRIKKSWIYVRSHKEDVKKARESILSLYSKLTSPGFEKVVGFNREICP